MCPRCGRNPFKRSKTNKNKGEWEARRTSPSDQVSSQMPCPLPWPCTEKAGPSPDRSRGGRLRAGLKANKGKL